MSQQLSIAQQLSIVTDDGDTGGTVLTCLAGGEITAERDGKMTTNLVGEKGRDETMVAQFFNGAGR